jgi:hypothetical protein
MTSKVFKAQRFVYLYGTAVEHRSLLELHFQHEALSHFIENVLRSTLSYPNETSKECIQFLNKCIFTKLNAVFMHTKI